MTSFSPVFKALLLPCVCLCMPSQILSNGYSRVANQNTLSPSQMPQRMPPGALFLGPYITDNSHEGPQNLPKSLVQIPPVKRTKIITPYSEQENALDHVAPMSDTEGASEESNSMSAKESLAIFMRKHMYGNQSGAAMLRQQPMAAPLAQEEISSMMKKRLSQFVKKLMKAEISEVRVERRDNGLRV